MATGAELKIALAGIPSGNAASREATPRIIITADISIPSDWSSGGEGIRGDVVIESNTTRCNHHHHPSKRDEIK